MDIANLPLFQALGHRMDFISQRQGVLAQNIANADTPDYRPNDLMEPKFDKLLKKAGATSTKGVMLASTNPKHMASDGSTGLVGEAKVRGSKDVYEVSPSGNAVILEEQMMKSAKNTMDYALMTNIYRKNIGILKTAIGGQ